MGIPRHIANLTISSSAQLLVHGSSDLVLIMDGRGVVPAVRHARIAAIKDDGDAVAAVFQQCTG